MPWITKAGARTKPRAWVRHRDAITAAIWFVLVALMSFSSARALARWPAPALRAASTAFAIGVVLLRGVKGSGLHRKLGYTWVAAMAVTAVSSFFITGLNGTNFSFIHGLSAWTVIGLPMGIAAARRKNIRKHSKDMTNMFVGGLLIAGLFTFLAFGLTPEWLLSWARGFAIGWPTGFVIAILIGRPVRMIALRLSGIPTT